MECIIQEKKELMQFDSGSVVVGSSLVSALAIVIGLLVAIRRADDRDIEGRKKWADGAALIEKIWLSIEYLTRMQKATAELACSEPGWVSPVVRRLDTLIQLQRSEADSSPQQLEAWAASVKESLRLISLNTESTHISMQNIYAKPVQYIGLSKADMEDALRSLTAEYPGCLRAALGDILFAFTELPSRMMACVTPSVVDTKQSYEEAVHREMTPVRELLSRIAAETELTRRKFDALSNAMGVDVKGEYASRIEERPEESAAVFQELVMEEMKSQNLNWEQATSSVKARLAHRSFGR